MLCECVCFTLERAVGVHIGGYYCTVTGYCIGGGNSGLRVVWCRMFALACQLPTLLDCQLVDLAYAW